MPACLTPRADAGDAPRRERPSFSQGLHALHLYGAAAVAVFGGSVCALLGWDGWRWVPLWFCGAVLIYNADRLKGDAADALNVPGRERAMRRWRGGSWSALGGAAAVLVGWPVVARDWLTLGLVLGGTVVALGYSLPRRGWRIKDVPVVKSLFAPTAVVLAVFSLPWLHGAPGLGPGRLAGAVGWAWSFLCANMLLCDLRDVAGDRATGVRSVPVLLGEGATRGLVGGLAVGGAVLAWRLGAGTVPGWGWLVLAGLGPVVLGVLLAVGRVRRGEGFYEWWVEGMFFLPLLALGVERMLG